MKHCLTHQVLLPQIPENQTLLTFFGKKVLSIRHVLTTMLSVLEALDDVEDSFESILVFLFLKNGKMRGDAVLGEGE